MAATNASSALLSRGSSVMLKSLRDESLNGHVGKILGFNADSERYSVAVAGRQLAVKKANLCPWADIAESHRNSKRMYRYGDECWRPDCAFSHCDEHARASKWLDHWQSLQLLLDCEGSDDKKVIADPPFLHGDTLDCAPQLRSTSASKTHVLRFRCSCGKH